MATAFSLDKFVTSSPLARAKAVAKGLPVSAVRDLVADRVVTLADVARVVGPRRTLDRRLKQDTPLSPQESDRLARFAAILKLATHIFGSRDHAMKWLDSPKRRFDDHKPLDMLRTDAGAQMIEELLQQAQHGMMA